MSRGAYYNEIEPKAVEWLRELIKQGHIAPGEIDERDIRDVTADDLRGFTQHHFFAGIGVWSFALRLAGWPDDRPVWTGSCPCQPFSAAGKGAGFDDERHLWPAWHWLIREYRPDVVFGEQVASKHGITWLDLVSSDMEGEGYACGPVVLPACGVGAPHIRQRLWFVADSSGVGWGQGNQNGGRSPSRTSPKEGPGSSDSLGSERLADSGRVARGLPEVAGEEDPQARRSREALGMGDSRGDRDREHARELLGDEGQHEVGKENGDHAPESPGPVNGAWRDAEWIYCRDEKYRPVEPGSSTLAHGAPERLGRLRCYGNAIVAQAAAEIIKAYRER